MLGLHQTRSVSLKTLACLKQTFFSSDFRYFSFSEGFLQFLKLQFFSTEKSKNAEVFVENYNHLAKTSVFLKFLRLQKN